MRRPLGLRCQIAPLPQHLGHREQYCIQLPRVLDTTQCAVHYGKPGTWGHTPVRSRVDRPLRPSGTELKPPLAVGPHHFGGRSSTSAQTRPPRDLGPGHGVSRPPLFRQVFRSAHASTPSSPRPHAHLSARSPNTCTPACLPNKHL